MFAPPAPPPRRLGRCVKPHSQQRLQELSAASRYEAENAARGKPPRNLHWQRFLQRMLLAGRQLHRVDPTAADAQNGSSGAAGAPSSHSQQRPQRRAKTRCLLDDPDGSSESSGEYDRYDYDVRDDPTAELGRDEVVDDGSGNFAAVGRDYWDGEGGGGGGLSFGDGSSSDGDGTDASGIYMNCSELLQSFVIHSGARKDDILAKLRSALETPSDHHPAGSYVALHQRSRRRGDGGDLFFSLRDASVDVDVVPLRVRSEASYHDASLCRTIDDIATRLGDPSVHQVRFDVYDDDAMHALIRQVAGNNELTRPQSGWGVMEHPRSSEQHREPRAAAGGAQQPPLSVWLVRTAGIGRYSGLTDGIVPQAVADIPLVLEAEVQRQLVTRHSSVRVLLRHGPRQHHQPTWLEVVRALLAVVKGPDFVDTYGLCIVPYGGADRPWLAAVRTEMPYNPDVLSPLASQLSYEYL